MLGASSELASVMEFGFNGRTPLVRLVADLFIYLNISGKGHTPLTCR